MRIFVEIQYLCCKTYVISILVA